MSFFKLSTGQTAQSDGNFDAGGSSEPIPEGTKVRACITEAGWKEYQGSRYINLRWDVVDGEYKKRVIFQKVRVDEDDPKKRDKALMMLAAIDANCGGKLAQLEGEPTDMDLTKALANKPVVIRLGVWENEEKTKSGNWVQAVEGSAKKPAASKPAASTAKKEPVEELDGPDIPF